jgi:pimeloyl-ACP methyl ester carboxylesterase
MRTTIEKLAGADIEISRQGEGPTVLFLHPHTGLYGSERFIALLSERARVIAPSHPGFGRSELPRGLNTVDDLAYFYLDLIEALGLREFTMVGASFGAWIAAEIAIKSCGRLSSLVLAGALGAKFGPRECSDVVDVFSQSRARLETLYFHNPGRFRRDPAALSDEELTVIARNWESTALFAWMPYMHDPKLRGWLHRIRVPALVLAGAEDRLVPPDYGGRYAEAIPGAAFERIDAAGHFPHIEQPEATAHRVTRFMRDVPADAGRRSRHEDAGR